MYKKVYDKCDNPDTVLERARERIGERKYSPLNNCEHFATSCKTKQKKFSQILPFLARAGIGATAGGNGGCGTVTGRCVAKCALEEKKAKKGTTTTVKEVKSLLTCGGPTEVLKTIRSTAATGGREIGKNATKTLCKAGWLGATSVVTEGCLFGYSCYRAQKKYEAAANTLKCRNARKRETKRSKKLHAKQLEQQSEVPHWAQQ